MSPGRPVGPVGPVFPVGPVLPVGPSTPSKFTLNILVIPDKNPSTFTILSNTIDPVYISYDETRASKLLVIGSKLSFTNTLLPVIYDNPTPTINDSVLFTRGSNKILP